MTGHGHGGGAASGWVARWAPLAGAGKVLDLACGMGRHARLFAALGHPVLAVDRDASALIHAAGDGIVTLHADLENQQAAATLAAICKPAQYAAIVVTNYLHRPLMAQLAASLAADGVLIYETFAQGNEAYGKPSNPAFLLAPGELLAFAAQAGLRVLAYEDGLVHTAGPAMVQRLCAVGREFPMAQARLDHFTPAF